MEKKEVQIMCGGKIVYEGEFDIDKILSAINNWIRWRFTQMIWRKKARILVNMRMSFNRSWNENSIS